MALKDLSELVSPPSTPIESGNDVSWSEIERSLEVVLPSDYKKYINTFGSGQIGLFLTPFNPFSSNEYLNLLNQANVRLNALREIKEKYGESECPYRLHPEPEGLLPWGCTDNGDVLFWLTVGNPDEWVTVINESRGPMFEQYEESMTGFLAKLISREIASQIIPEDFLDRSSLFTPLV